MQRLFDRLEHQANFNISPLQMMRALQMLHEHATLMLSETGRRELKFLLAPILCYDAEQQSQFYGIYEEYLDKDLKYSPTELQQLGAQAEIEKKEEVLNQAALPLPTDASGDKFYAEPAWVKWIPILFAILAIFLLIAYLISHFSRLEKCQISIPNEVLEVTIGDELDLTDKFQVYRIDSLIKNPDPNLSYKWRYIDGHQTLSDFDLLGLKFHSDNANWTFKVPSPGDNYRKGLQLNIYDKTTNTPLSANLFKLIVKHPDHPVVPNGISIDRDTILERDTIIFSVENADTLKYNYQWEFKDGHTAQGIPVKHAFEKAGKYKVSLKITCIAPVEGKCELTLDKTLEIQSPGVEEPPIALATLELKKVKALFIDKLAGWTYAFLLLLFVLALKKWRDWRQFLKHSAESRKEIEAQKQVAKKESIAQRFAIHDKSPYSIPFASREKEYVKIQNEQLEMASLMRQRQQGLRKNLDVEATIAATVQKSGFLDLKYRYNTRPSDYLVLIDEQSGDSHQARLFQYLTGMLRNQDVLLEVMFYRKDLNRFWNKHFEKGISLKQLHRVYANQRLIIFGDAHALVDNAGRDDLLEKQTEETLRLWKKRLLITPLPVVSWTYKEARLYRLFGIFPSDLKGLIQATKYIDSGMEEEDLPATLADWEAKLQERNIRYEAENYESDTNRSWRTLADHENYLKDHPDVLRWLKALAVYPNPNWNITIAIGNALGVKVTFDNLLLLSRIPWLQESAFPTRLWREILKKDSILESDATLARQAVIGELNAAKKEAAGGFANRKLETDLAVQNFALAPTEEVHRDVMQHLLAQGLLPKIHREELDWVIHQKFKGTYPLGSVQGDTVGDYLKDKKEKPVPIVEDPKWSNTHFVWACLISMTFLLFGMSMAFSPIEDWMIEEVPMDQGEAARKNDEAVDAYYRNTGNVKKDSLFGDFTKPEDTSRYSRNSLAAKSLLNESINQPFSMSILEAMTNLRKLAYNNGVYNYQQFFTAKDSTFLLKAKRYLWAYDIATEYDSIYTARLHGLAHIYHHLGKQDSTCLVLDQLLAADSSFFASQPVPNIYTQTGYCDTTSQYFIHARIVNQDNQPVEGATVLILDGPDFKTKADGMVTHAFETRPSRQRLIYFKVLAEGYEEGSFAFQIRPDTNDLDVIRLKKKEVVDETIEITNLTMLGSLAYNCPDEMVLNNTYQLSLKLDASEQENTTINQDGGNMVEIRLTATDPSVFEIINISSSEQVIQKGKVTEWQFNVKPIKKGTHKLFFRISYSKDGRFKKELPVIEKTIEVTEAGTYALARFPMPPPGCYSSYQYPENSFSGTLGEVADEITQFLQDNEYKYTYLTAPGGFAIVTHLERYNEDGSNLPASERAKIQPAESFSWSMNYIKSLLFTQTGYLRIFVFIVSDQSIQSSSGKMDIEKALSWISPDKVINSGTSDTGTNSLSPELRARTFSSNQQVSALVYEFEKGQSDSEARTICPPRLTAQTHLGNAGILEKKVLNCAKPLIARARKVFEDGKLREALDILKEFEKCADSTLGDLEEVNILEKEINDILEGGTGTIPIPALTFVRGGTFDMGCTPEQGDDCDDDEKPVRRDVLVKDFYIGTYEVTNEQFAAFLTANGEGNKVEGGETWVKLEGRYENVICGIEEISPGQFRAKAGLETHPMIYVSWYGARVYCTWLSAREKKRFRLPTEAEWEYAARGGTQSKKFKYSGSNSIDEVAWYNSNSEERTHSIEESRGELKANELGIYNMSGNVWEWTQDCWHDTYNNAPKDQRAWLEDDEGDCSRRVLRGGGWYSLNSYCRVSNRDRINPNIRHDDIVVFRVVQD